METALEMQNHGHARMDYHEFLLVCGIPLSWVIFGSLQKEQALDPLFSCSCILLNIGWALSCIIPVSRTLTPLDFCFSTKSVLTAA
jgi:hypothetical protein